MTESTHNTKPHQSRKPRANPYVDNQTCWQGWTSGLPSTNRLSAFLDADSRATLDMLCNDLDGRLATGQNPTRAVDHFLADGDNIEDYRNRYATVRLLEKLSGMKVRPVHWTGVIDTDGGKRRLLTPLEQTLVRVCATASIQKVGLIGLSEAGAGSGELHPIVGFDVNVDSAGRATHLAVVGTERDVKSGYPVCQPRQIEIPEWCQQKIGALATAKRHHPLLYGGDAPDPADRQSAVLMVIKKVFDDAGLSQDRTVTPMSLRNTAAARRRQTAGLEAAAAMLGITNFETVAREIGLHARLPCR